MKATLTFSLPPEPETDALLARIKDAFTLVNEDKEEQAIDPEAFRGNLADYPDWLEGACRDRRLVEALERFCEFDPGELGDWCLESWYEELATCEAWNFQVRRRRDGDFELTFDVAEEHYGGDIAPAWLLLAAGATDVRCMPIRADEE